MESRNLFIEVLTNVAFQNTDIVLFLNKKDIFEEKIKLGNFQKYITQYKGPADCSESAIQYIKTGIFEKAFNQYAAKVFYCHVTTATDTSNADRLFSYIYDMVFEKLMLELKVVI